MHICLQYVSSCKQIGQRNRSHRRRYPPAGGFRPDPPQPASQGRHGSALGKSRPATFLDHFLPARSPPQPKPQAPSPPKHPCFR